MRITHKTKKGLTIKDHLLIANIALKSAGKHSKEEHTKDSMKTALNEIDVVLDLIRKREAEELK